MDLGDRVWNPTVRTNIHPEEVSYLTLVTEQYKVYADHADRVAVRRSHANRFFITLNSLFIGGIGVLFGSPVANVAVWFYLLPLVLMLLLCALWWLLISSYATLSRAKFEVIDKFEERLPARPFVEAEWRGLLRPQGARSPYRDLTKLEHGVVGAFAAVYVVAFALAAVLS